MNINLNEMICPNNLIKKVKNSKVKQAHQNASEQNIISDEQAIERSDLYRKVQLVFPR
jgi:hypothetical protein